MVALVRLVHPAPALAVTVLSAALAAILVSDAGRSALAPSVALITLAVAGSQIFTGALNDWADRERDAARSDKPIPAGQLTPRAALLAAAAGAAIQLIASFPLGGLALVLGLIASSSAAVYNLVLSRTPFSVVPYLVSFGALPLWIGAGVGVPLERVVGASLLVAPFATAAHLVNVLRDYDADAASGSRNLAQVLGQLAAHRLAVALALSTGIVLGVVLLVGGRLGTASAAFGAIGVVAIAYGVPDTRRLWIGMLLAAVAWTVAWALSPG